MKYLNLIVIVLFFGLNSGDAQNLEIEGKAIITEMDPATASATPVAREADGTLSLITTGITYSVGDFAQGGVVYEVYGDGQHGKVVSVHDVVDVGWSNVATAEIGLSARDTFNGAGNTLAIIMQDGHSQSAAKLCADLAYAGYDDWYLPARDELEQIYLSKASIDQTSTLFGGIPLQNAFYWTSTEHSSTQARILDMGSGNSGVSNKANPIRMRAIRTF